MKLAIFNLAYLTLHVSYAIIKRPPHQIDCCRLKTMIVIRFLLNLNLFQQNLFIRRIVVTYLKLKMAANWLAEDFSS